MAEDAVPTQVAPDADTGVMELPEADARSLLKDLIREVRAVRADQALLRQAIQTMGTEIGTLNESLQKCQANCVPTIEVGDIDVHMTSELEEDEG